MPPKNRSTAGSPDKIRRIETQSRSVRSTAFRLARSSSYRLKIVAASRSLPSMSLSLEGDAATASANCSASKTSSLDRRMASRMLSSHEGLERASWN